MEEIANEFTESIFSPTSKKIMAVATFPNNQFWVALVKGKVIGTIGLTTLSNSSIVLKSMFLARKFRGKGISKLFLDTVKSWCNQNEYETIYLGTMAQFKGGQKFYEKNQFKIISKTDLPLDFPINPLDSVFYKSILK